MKRSTLAGSVAACICLGLSVPVLAAEPPVAGAATQQASSVKNFSTPKPAEKCLGDLRAFDTQMEKDGYWLGGSGDGLGYPMEGYGVYGSPLMDGRAEATGIGYRNARPGYELRTLIASANILARQGQQQPCEDVLATTRQIYKVYVADMNSGKMPRADVQSWQAAAGRRSATGHRHEHVVPVRRVGRHRGARPAERGSRQRRRPRDEFADKQDRLCGDRPRRNFRD